MKILEIVIFTPLHLIFYQKYRKEKCKIDTFSLICFLYQAIGSNWFLVVEVGF